MSERLVINRMRRYIGSRRNVFKQRWACFWLKRSGLDIYGRLATRLALWYEPPYKARCYLARYSPNGIVSPSAVIDHSKLQLSRDVYLGDRVTIYEANNSGPVILNEGVRLYSDIIIETGEGGALTIGEGTHIQPRCSLSAYKGSIRIGKRVEIAPNCGFYPYNHAVEPNQSIQTQALVSKGDIIIEDDAWLGFGRIVLEGGRIGTGAVVGAGAVVTKDVPEGAIAVGNPARIIGNRSDKRY